MAYRLSFSSMNPIWQRCFSRVAAFLWLLLVASLAPAEAACGPASGAEALGSRAAGQDRCLTASASAETCIIVPQRIDVRAAAAASSSPEPLPAASAAEQAGGILRSIAEQPPIGLAPVSHVPVHILLRRYLS